MSQRRGNVQIHIIEIQIEVEMFWCVDDAGQTDLLSCISFMSEGFTPGALAPFQAWAVRSPINPVRNTNGAKPPAIFRTLKVR
jgi:hypothetical protein